MDYSYRGSRLQNNYNLENKNRDYLSYDKQRNILNHVVAAKPTNQKQQQNSGQNQSLEDILWDLYG